MAGNDPVYAATDQEQLFEKLYNAIPHPLHLFATGSHGTPGAHDGLAKSAELAS